MATIPRDIIDNLTYALNTLSGASKRAIIKRLQNLVYTDIADLREQLIEILEPYFSAATDDAAAYAAIMYDEIREFATGYRLGAYAISMRNPEATEGAIRAFVGEVEKTGLEPLIRKLCERIDYEIKKSAADCLFYNGGKDPMKPKFARVPTGSETCDFCIMLASRGFVYNSKDSAGAFDHWHPNCDCRVVVGFQGATKVDGYDPDELYRRWKESGFNPGKSEKRNRSSHNDAGNR